MSPVCHLYVHGITCMSPIRCNLYVHGVTYMSYLHVTVSPICHRYLLVDHNLHSAKHVIATQLPRVSML